MQKKSVPDVLAETPKRTVKRDLTKAINAMNAVIVFQVTTGERKN